MSSFLNVCRVKIQEIDERGWPQGDPDYGILASDDYEQQFTNAYRTLRELNQAIRDAGNILDVVGGFHGVIREGIGYKNFVGRPRASTSAADE